MAELRDINSLPLAPTVASSLLKHGFRVVGDLVSVSPIELSQECGLSMEVCVTVIETVKSCLLSPDIRLSHSSKSIENNSNSQSVSLLSSQALAAENILTAKDLIYKWSSLKPIISFCKEIDVMLGGGFPIGQITELCGVPGIGKTQLAMQLAINVQLPEIFQGAGGSAVYIDTEGSFLPERVFEMANELSQHLHKLVNHNVAQFQQQQRNPQRVGAPSQLSEESLRQQRLAAEKMTAEAFLSNIHLYRCFHQSDLIAVLNRLKAQLLPSSASTPAFEKLRLIVVDSIAFPFRSSVQEVVARNRVLNQLLQLLNEIAYERQIAVVLVNHMTSKASKSVTTEGESSSGSGPAQQQQSTFRLVPALGEQFSHGIANRIFLHYDDHLTGASLANGNVERRATLLKSPSMPSKTVSFTVNQRGIRDYLTGSASQPPDRPSGNRQTHETQSNEKRQRLL